MVIHAERAEFGTIAPMRDMLRHESHCQIIADSILGRGLADPYLILADGKPAGYGGVRNRYDPGYVMEFYTLPALRASARALFRAFLDVSAATHIQAQTNMPLMLLMLFDFGCEITAENFLFEDDTTTSLACPGARFRRARAGDDAPDAGADWALDVDGKVVASGGFLTHYNPPYGDIYMSVAADERQKGYGSYMVQELKRVCYEAGRRPAARCNADNIASQLTLQRAGMLPCGRLLTGKVAP